MRSPRSAFVITSLAASLAAGLAPTVAAHAAPAATPGPTVGDVTGGDSAPVDPAPVDLAPAVRVPTSPAVAPAAGAALTVPAPSVTAPAAAVAAPALSTGAPTVGVVTTTVVAGKPRLSTTTVPARQAMAAVDRAQDTPGAVAVSVDTPVKTTAYNDPLRSHKWDLTMLGGETFHSRVSTTGVTVAVIDTGVQASHPDLRGTVLPGVEYVSGRSTITGNGQVDPQGHGTHVAGIVAATANNATGVAGLAPGARILPVRVLRSDGVGWSSDVARGIVWATDHGAKVINMSLGGAYDANVEKAVQYAVSRSVVVVAAGGNERQEGNPVTYPANYAGVIGVAAVDRYRRAASFSNTGRYVDVAAPGVGIMSTYRTGTSYGSYVPMSGTSMATPQIAAVAAGLKAVRPTLTSAGVQGVLAATATDLGVVGRDDVYGAGLVNPNRALCYLGACPAAFAWSTPSWTPVAGTTAPATVTLRTANGGAIAQAPVSVCYRYVDAATPSCYAKTSDAAGRIDATFAARRITAVTVRYAGSSVARAASSVVTFRTAYNLEAWAGTRSVSAVVWPRQTTVDLMRYDTTARAWSLSRRLTTTPSGSVTATGVTPGTYRVTVPGSAILAATSTGSVVVR
ncbi:S8 family serine peptidase [Arsenicicoccus dermatophilus]|uniref:S8 family serine peptidase n=1 Tax=Arsenicicoccus dermatophilus TaxID=1076331 RepID=UPI0039175050